MTEYQSSSFLPSPFPPSFSEKDWKIVKLSSLDIEAVYQFELTAWPPALQANKQTLLNRFELQHSMLGVWQYDQLIGLASWRRGWLDLDDCTAFPQTFEAFSLAPNAMTYNAAFAYNLSIHPAKRGTEITRALIMAVLDDARQSQCQYLVGDGRCPSYNGSHSKFEEIAQSPPFRAAIDHHILSRKRLNLEDYLYDSTLRFYYRMLDCRFLWVMQNFIPTDESSGGHRVIFYKPLTP